MGKQSHFKGNTVFEHLQKAREKGKRATEESHGIETSGHLIAGTDAAKEAAMVALVIWVIASTLAIDHKITHMLVGLVLAALFLWKIGRSAHLGWTRLERINQLIEDEKREIEENREEEKQELTEMYQAKGFTGDLLTKVIDVLMADDNKLLTVMMEEELGVSLESYVHPLKQAVGAGVGVFLAGCFLTIGNLVYNTMGIFVAAYLVVFLASYINAKIERVRVLNHVVWSLSILFLTSFGIYFITSFLMHEVL